jgi:hypothetical protein
MWWVRSFFDPGEETMKGDGTVKLLLVGLTGVFIGVAVSQPRQPQATVRAGSELPYVIPAQPVVHQVTPEPVRVEAPAPSRPTERPAKAPKGQVIAVPSDPGATYTALEVKRVGRLVSVTTMRQGKSGTSFSRREVDCDGRRFRYAGEGDTLDALRSSSTSDPMGPMALGSISYHVSMHACQVAKRA